MQFRLHSLLVAGVAALAFAGCTSDDDFAPSGETKSLSFVATIDGGARKSGASERMKTQLNPNNHNSVTFCTNDAISVFSASDSKNCKFTTKDSGESATFNGSTAEADNYYALYPHQADASISGTTIMANFPAEQTAYGEAPYFDPSAALSVATADNTNREFYFYNVGSLVKFTTTEPLAKIVFKGNNGENVAGNVSITVGSDPTATGADQTSITLKPATGQTSIAAGTYYIAVLPQTFAEGFTFEAYRTAATSEADFTRTINKKVEFGRSHVYNVGTIDPFNGHDYVDFGIEIEENGVKYKLIWATMNVGAETVTGYGDYFAWGDVEPYYEDGWKVDGKSQTRGNVYYDGNWKSTLPEKVMGYCWANYKWCDNGNYYNLKKYNTNYSYGTNPDNKTTLDLEDDAARHNWGGGWKTPTRLEIATLKSSNYSMTWVENYNGSGVNGFLIKNVSDNPQTMFLPAAGGTFEGGGFGGVNILGHYWSASLSDVAPNTAWEVNLTGVAKPESASQYARFNGCPIRPVVLVPVTDK